MDSYTLTRSHRKTLAVHIRDGSVEVRAPLKCPQSEIDRFLASKQAWITGKLVISRELAEQKKSFTLDYGDTILFCGVLYLVAARAGARAGFDGEQFYMPPNLTPDQIKATCIKIYRRLAKTHLAERVAIFATQMGITPAAIKITGAKTRWGSCSSRKNINFSWRLIMAADNVIDYVVVHELAHIIHMNHSKRFWAVVEAILPDYLTRKSQLRELQRRLAAEDWED